MLYDATNLDLFAITVASVTVTILTVDSKIRIVIFFVVLRQVLALTILRHGRKLITHARTKRSLADTFFWIQWIRKKPKVLAKINSFFIRKLLELSREYLKKLNFDRL